MEKPAAGRRSRARRAGGGRTGCARRLATQPRVAFQAPPPEDDLKVPSMLLPLTRPLYWVPLALKLMRSPFSLASASGADPACR